MNKEEFLKGLGIAPKSEAEVVEPEVDGNPPEAKITKIVVPEDVVDKVTKDGDEPAPEEANAEELLGSVEAGLARVEGQVVASPTVVQSKELLETITTLQDEIGELKEAMEAMEAKLEAARCPSCQSIVGWSELPAERYDDREIHPEKQTLFSALIYSLVYGKRCPICKHFEEVEEPAKEKE